MTTWNGRRWPRLSFVLAQQLSKSCCFFHVTFVPTVASSYEGLSASQSSMQWLPSSLALKRAFVLLEVCGWDPASQRRACGCQMLLRLFSLVWADTHSSSAPLPFAIQMDLDMHFYLTSVACPWCMSESLKSSLSKWVQNRGENCDPALCCNNSLLELRNKTE